MAASSWGATGRAQQLPLPFDSPPERSMPTAELSTREVPAMANIASETGARLQVPGLTVAGGVSLGSYGGGFLYYYTLARHDRAGGVPFQVVTGASAGSINSVLAALAMCTKPDYSPEQNLFFDTWIPVGMEARGGMPGLNNPEQVTSRALFSRDPIDVTARKLQAVFESRDLSHWTDEGCDTLLGLVSTQLVPARVGLQKGVPITPSVSRQSQRFLVRIKRDRDKAPIVFPDVRNVDPDVLDLFPVLGHPAPPVNVDHPQPIPFTLLTDLLKASSSFPLAFEPYRLPLSAYDYDKKAWQYVCDPSSPKPPPGQGCSKDPEFIDGGVYENVPLHFAQRVQAWRQLPLGNMVVDTEATPWRRPERVNQSKTDLVGFLGGLVGSVLSATLSAELFSTFESNPMLRNSNSPVAFTVRQLPTASGHFANFLGFFDRDFRVFDFYLGMLDAKTFVGDENAVSVPPALGAEWQVMRCFEEWHAASDGFARFPAAAAIPACHALHVGSWDAANNAWKQDGTTDRSTPSQRSRYNMVRLLAAAQHFRRHEEWEPDLGLIGEVDLWFELMADQQIALQDVSEKQLSNVRALVRDELFGLLEVLASKQEKTIELVLQVGLRAVANALDYREPRWHLALGLHALRGLELGSGWSRSQFRVEGNFRLSNVDLRSPRRFGADLRVGPRLVWAAGELTGAALQLEPFVGCGYYATFHEDGNARGFKPELGLYFVLLQRLYLSLAGELRIRTAKQRGFDESEYGREDLSWGVFGSLGWRFLWGTAKQRF